ncbi:MAG: GNAT family N-acetyltransferase [Dactylosporangium sp.]|nr:GNAT family N-acetyltransferase [Dactylosporangium sp.]NNJ63040.1 GNAT family N-acetyltransferase [Dactylosporangium sp.]
MTGDLPAIVRATPDDIGAVADTIAAAFCSLQAATWLVPDRSSRRRVLAADFAILADHAMDHGAVHRLADGSGAAVWLYRDGPIPPPPDYDRRLEAACGPFADRFRTLDLLLDCHRPAQPHHYLACLAVRPPAQGTGRGTGLLRHAHAHLDAMGTSSYLEATGPRVTRLYARWGYERLAPFALPDGTGFYPMWRDAT